MESTLQDLRYAIRTVLKNYRSTAIIISILGLSIGANTVLFSFVNGILLRPIPYKNPDELVRIWDSWQENRIPGSNRSEVAPANFIDWREQANSFTEIAAFSSTTAGLATGGEPEQIVAAVVTAGFFQVLGVEPILGRTLSLEDNKIGHESVVLLSHGLWKRRFGSNPNIIGQAVMLDGESHAVVGVLPSGFQYPEKTEIWAPVVLDAATYDILKLVVGEGIGLTVIGVAIGLVGAFAVTRAISSFLFGVSATDPVTFAVIALVLSCTSALASYVPARRATRVDPMIALRSE